MSKTILDTSYFAGEMFIAGLENQRTNETLCKWIEEFEPVFLRNVMGYGLYSLFKAGTAVTDDDIAQRWKDITFGAEYEVGGITKKWEGLRIPERKKSVIGAYVYSKYQLNLHTQTTQMGETQADVQNAVRVSVGAKVVRVWNGYLMPEVAILWEFLSHKKDSNGDRVYPEFDTSNVEYDDFQYLNQYGI